MNAVSEQGSLALCGRPRCRQEFRQPVRGRHRVYCSDPCRRLAEGEQRHVRTLIERHQRTIKMLERDLAAFGPQGVR